MNPLKGRLVLVEDPPTHEDHFSRIFIERGYALRQVPIGPQALPMIREELPDVILVNITTSESEGCEMCRRLKADESLRDIPVIFLNAHERIKENVKAAHIENIDYICNPLDVEEIILRIQNRLELRDIHKQLHEQTRCVQQQIQELALLHRVSLLFNSTIEWDRVLEIVLGEVCRLLNIHTSSFWLWVPEAGELVCQQATGPGKEKVIGWRMLPGQGVVGQTAQTGEIIKIDDLRQTPQHYREIDQSIGVEYRSIISIPFCLKERVMGVMNLLDTAVARFTQDDVRLVESVGAAAIRSIENARLYLAAQQEIADRKKAESALQKAKEEALEAQRAAEAAQRAAEAAQRAAEAANQAKSIFLSNMSHELRSPLTAILGFAQVMTRSVSLPPEHRGDVDIIRRSGEHLLTLINQVLDLSKIEAGRMTLNAQNIDLHRLLHDIQDMFSLNAEKKGLQLLFEQDEHIPRCVRTDEVKLRQVLINLLNNAIKFTERGGVAVRVRRVGEFGEFTEFDEFDEFDEFTEFPPRDRQLTNSPTQKLLFEIEDSGSGIAPEEIDTVFEAFGQSESGRQSQEGTGLGLPISRKFVQLMGGTMQVSSKVGHGSLFTFEIQMQVVEANEPDSHCPARRVLELEPGQRTAKRVLVVDDRSTNRQLVIKLLSNLGRSNSESPPSGFILQEAANGQEAVEIYESWKPHLIWMDMRMPVMDGYEATRRIRGLEAEGSEAGSAQFHTKIIALTASSFEEERACILASGCNDYLRKPFREEELFELLCKHLEVRFIYEEDEQKTEGNGQKGHVQLTPEALAALPAEWVATLQQSAEEVDVELLSSTIDNIRGRDPALADALTRLAKDFEYDDILAAIQRARKGVDAVGNEN